MVRNVAACTRPLVGLGVLLSSLALVSCGSANVSGTSSPEPVGFAGDDGHHASATPGTGEAGAGAALPSEPKDGAPSAPPEPAFAVSPLTTTRLLEGDIVQFAPGEDGRIGTLVAEGGLIVPKRWENGAWQSLTLPEEHALDANAFAGGIYFGRDHRPRLMGFTRKGEAAEMVYLRFINGAWRTEFFEIGSLGGKPQAPLFGVLGNDDPEVVCKEGVMCLTKSRKGWNELPSALPPKAVVRAFHENGYAATAEGLLCAEKKDFRRIGAKAPWSTDPTGLWVGPQETAVVVAGDQAYAWDGSKAWTPLDTGLEAPRDVAGASGLRLFVGRDGVRHHQGGDVLDVRFEDKPLAGRHVVELGDGQFLVGGPTGLFRVTSGGSP